MGLLNMATCFIKSSKEKETESFGKTEGIILCNRITDVKFQHLCHIFLARSKSQVPPTLKEREIHKIENIERQGSSMGLSKILSAIPTKKDSQPINL